MFGLVIGLAFELVIGLAFEFELVIGLAFELVIEWSLKRLGDNSLSSADQNRSILYYLNC